MASEQDKPESIEEERVPQWRPLTLRQRRVLGVLIEKAKTTPDAYPMTLNGLTTGCNQKSNRDPVMNLTPDEVEETVEQLRAMGAVVEVQGGGRVAKYRHQSYEWFGVDKVELAVLAELLLRGEQSVGDLRGRAARMEPFPDVNALRPVLQSLIQKKLVIALTPEGRGQIITHGLYPPQELEQLRKRVGAAVHTVELSEASASASTGSAPKPSAPAPGGVTLDMYNELQVDVAELRAEVSRLRQELRELKEQLGPS